MINETLYLNLYNNKMSQENQKTEMVDINELLRAEGIRKDDTQTEVTGEDVFAKLTNTQVEEVVTPPQIEEQPEVVIPKEKEKEAIVAPIQTPYTDKLKDYISAGFLEDVEIIVGEGEEEKQVFLSELTDLDADTFNAIIVQYKEAKDKELKEKYISREGLDERTEKYIELKKAGGDISKLVETEIQYVNPLSTYNLDDESHQEELVRRDLTAQGLRPKVIEAQIQEFKEDMSLDLEAKKIAERINTQFDTYLDSKKQEQLASIEADKAEQKEFRKSIGEELKSLISDENISKVILDNSTKRDENGLTNTERLFFEAQKNPKQFAKIALYLNNEEAFLKLIGAKTKLKETVNTVNTLLRINPSVVKNIKKETLPETEGDIVFKKLTTKFNQ